MSATVLLVRHPPVTLAWRKRCYGRSDMGWSRDGLALARRLAGDLAVRPIDAIVHSGALRTARLAALVARHGGVPVRADPGWLERDFGAWEGRTWHAIWRETGDLMDRMMTDPEGFRPGGGETGRELSERAKAAWGRLPRYGTTLVIAHGGPIAALRTWQAGESLAAMVRFVPGCGEVVEVARMGKA
jgi:broad specificity phosphatase PhoE